MLAQLEELGPRARLAAGLPARELRGAGSRRGSRGLPGAGRGGRRPGRRGSRARPRASRRPGRGGLRGAGAGARRRPSSTATRPARGLIALNMALSGTPREETAGYLADRFDLADPEALLDDVYARAGG